jgi:hypothetical protein
VLNTTGAISGMYNILLAVFLVFSLASQAPCFGAQMNSDARIAGLTHTAGPGRIYSTDFDDDQRGSKIFALSVVDLSIPCELLREPNHPSDRHLDFYFASLPLFTLYASLLI